MNFKPLLAATVEDVRQVQYPKMVSPKLDGIRCIIHEGKAVSRNLKPIRNLSIQACLKGLPEGLDGELIVGEPTGELVFNRTTSGVMSGSGNPDFKFHVFDMAHMPTTFNQRFISLHKIHHPHVKLVNHWHVYNETAMLETEKYCLEMGYEGIMLRSPGGEYKYGRSTMNEQILLKLKRFRDGEAVIVAFDEGVHNLNEPTTNALGHTVRSTHQDNKVGSERIGTLHGLDLKTREPLVISPGRMTQEDRMMFFKFPGLLLGKVVKYKTFDYGKVNASRFCTFQGFRDVNDLG
jgi:DNA ligase 1